MTIYQEGIHIVDGVIVGGGPAHVSDILQRVWDMAARNSPPNVIEIRGDSYLAGLFGPYSWRLRFTWGRPYHRTASNRKRRKRFYRNR